MSEKTPEREDATPLIDDFNDGDTPAGVCLLVIGEGFVTTYPLPREGAMVLGRAGQADIAIDVVGVSRNHARIHIGTTEEGTSIEIEDLGSANGTFVHDERLPPNRKTMVAIGDPIELGALTVMVQQTRALVRPRRIWTHGYFEARLEEECARARRAAQPFSLLRLKMDLAGNRLAREALVSALREEDTLASYGPSDFELLISGVGPGAQLDEIVQGVHRRLLAKGVKVRIGVASYPADGRAAEVLMSKACAAVMTRKSKAEQPSPEVIVQSGVMKRLHRLVERVAAGSINVLLLGETGVGKEIFAERVHTMSPRASKRMVKLNCAAFNESLVESELFGHVKGAFTGALADKPGLFESANGGTIFLDEIGDLPSSLQAKLLRVLEDKRVRRVGSVEDHAVDVRVVAATHRDLDADVLLGTFRQDLYFRLNGVSIQIPPLRERQDEVEPLARMFLERSCAEQSLGPAPALGEDALKLLSRYSWPGNLRELRNAMERAALLSCDGEVLLEHLPVDKMQADSFLAPTDRRPVEGTALRDDLESRERELIVAALERAGGNQSQAAKDLGISRGTLIDRITTYGLPRPRKNRK